MARYKPIDTSPRFLAVDLERQLLPGSVQEAVCFIHQPGGRSPGMSGPEKSGRSYPIRRLVMQQAS